MSIRCNPCCNSYWDSDNSDDNDDNESFNRKDKINQKIYIRIK